mgnify:CR=1 FL=1
MLALYQKDPATKAVVMIGEIGGSAEEEAAEFVASQMNKPVVAFIAGAPRRRANAWATRARSSRAARALPRAKRKALEKAGIPVSISPASIGETLAQTAPNVR